jgi:hypothetical protein
VIEFGLFLFKGLRLQLFVLLLVHHNVVDLLGLLLQDYDVFTHFGLLLSKSVDTLLELLDLLVLCLKQLI